jgi:hypothetical protein
MLKVIGKAKASATVKVKPGTEPKTIPTSEPRPTAAIAEGFTANDSACKKSSIF